MSNTNLLTLARRARRAGLDIRDAVECAAALLGRDDGDLPANPVGDIVWDDYDTYAYVACVYGVNGDEAGDCYTRVGQDAAGVWWHDDGDEDCRCDTFGPFASEQWARDEAHDFAIDADEAPCDADAAAYTARLIEEARERTSPDGEWMVAWRDGQVLDRGDRYDSRDDAERVIDAWYDAVRAQTPNALTHLMLHPVLAVQQGSEWVEADDID